MPLLYLLIVTMIGVSVNPRVATAPTDIVVTVHILPNDNNRKLTIEVDSEEGISFSSSTSLDGADSPKMFVKQFRHLIAGFYLITATLSTTSKDYSSQTSIEVL